MKLDNILTDKRNTTLNRVIYGNRAVLRNNPNIVLARKNRVNLNAWITVNSTHNNIGDYLSLVVVESLCSQYGLDLSMPIARTKHLYAIGSILPGYQDAVIWGSGFGYEKPQRWYSPIYNWLHRHVYKLDIRAVRGPETRRILLAMGIECPEVYGDPAVLMPLIYQGKAERNQKEYLVIPHYSKLSNYKGTPSVLGTFTSNYLDFIDKMLEAKLVISSSLHGIILAEAYGIPAVMLCDTPSEDITKYKDWYYSTGRMTFPIAHSIDEALAIGGTPLEYSKIEQMQKVLLKTFPKDLWDA